MQGYERKCRGMPFQVFFAWPVTESLQTAAHWFSSWDITKHGDNGEVRSAPSHLRPHAAGCITSTIFHNIVNGSEDLDNTEDADADDAIVQAVIRGGIFMLGSFSPLKWPLKPLLISSFVRDNDEGYP